MKSGFSLFDPVGSLPGVGSRKAEAFGHAGIFRVVDLLRLLPRRFEDRTRILPFSSAQVSRESQGVFRARLEQLKISMPRGGLTIIWALFSDPSASGCGGAGFANVSAASSSGQLRARWFNQPYIARNLIPHKEYFLFGPVADLNGTPVLDNPEWEPADRADESPVTGALTPIYPKNKALSAARVSPRSLRRMISQAIANMDWKNSFPQIGAGSPFTKLSQAFINAHWPLDRSMADRACLTLAFFDQVLFQIGVLERRRKLMGSISLPADPQSKKLSAEIPAPFPLTGDQKNALAEILGDLTVNGRPMNRLLQGDVGSGKTIVAFLAMRCLSELLTPNRQCAFMAPTEILATQQHASFSKLFPEAAGKAVLLTGSLRGQPRRQLIGEIEAGNALYVFGTHSLFQEDVHFLSLSFAVIDEQQRFGVEHRRELVRKGQLASPVPPANSEPLFRSTPHLLLLSATPIPRTLSLTIFGDMDVSLIRELPPGRQPVETILMANWQASLPYINEHLKRGEQAYFICPIITSTGKSDRASLADACYKLSKALPNIPIESISGNQPYQENLATMEKFRDGAFPLLIATSMVEVGIDNPNATLMVIEDADRFGLSQLHQLRGRIGRGSRHSRCLLVSRKAEDGSSTDRLTIMARTNDGFEISQEDLRLRGPGDIVGNRQSGLCHPAFSRPLSQDLIEKSRRRAFELLTKEPTPVRDWFLARMAESFGSALETFMDGG